MKNNNSIRAFIVAAVAAITLGATAVTMTNCFSSSADKSSDTLDVADLNGLTDSIVVDGEVFTAESWADSVMKTLSPRKRVAQLFIPRWDIKGTCTPASVMKKEVCDEGVGGIIIGPGSVNQYADLINQYQKLAEVPLLFTIDGEWGPSMRIAEAPRFPHNIALGAIQDTKLIEEFGKEAARECREVGIQIDFAPVLDVNSNPDNPVIGFRSFGENPRRVAELGAAFIKGMEAEGVMSVGKHFPGHGDTSVDSHKALPTVTHSREVLEQIDFLPFKVAVGAGMSGIMIGHLRVPSLDASGVPASMSHKITTDIVRNELGFKGLIFTDALAMKGATQTGENNCVNAFIAGADMLLGPASPFEDIQAMMNAIKSGKIKQEEVDARCRRVLIYKFKLGLVNSRFVKKEGLVNRLNSPEAKALNDRLAKAAITVVKNSDNILPVNTAGKKNVVVISLGAGAHNTFASTCKTYGIAKSYSVNTEAEAAKSVAAAKDAEAVIVGVFKNNAVCARAFKRLMSDTSKVVPVFFVNPFKLKPFGNLQTLPTLVMAYDDTKELESAGAQAVFGAIDVTGRFPANIPGVAKMGEGISLKKKD